MFKIITGAAAITSAIDSIQRRGKKLDHDIHVAAVSAIDHHSKHGDVTLINRLVAAMPKGSRVNALREYIETFGAVVYDTDEKVFKHCKTKQARVQDAIKTSWVGFKPDPQYTPIMDPAKMVSDTIKRMEKDMEKMGDKSKVTAAMLSAMKDAERAMKH